MLHKFSEAEKYRAMLEGSKTRLNPGYSGKFAMMRHAVLYETESDRKAALDAIRQVLARFGNLMMQSGDVVNGYPDTVPLETLDGNFRVDPSMLEENLLFGTPEVVVKKLKQYQAIGIDAFIYYASLGLDMERQKKSLRLFIERVLPAFAGVKEFVHAD